MSEAAGDLHAKRARERIGMVLGGKWTIESLIGVGGMAAVYAATHRNGKRVAVKMLHADLSDHEEVRKRFLQEGYAANTIQHEGAVSVLDDDVAADGSAFLVMELLEGETVEDRWERAGRRLAGREVLAIVEQVLAVLSAAHHKNIVHRDIKPENLFVTKAGAVKVLDFGIAKVFEGDSGRPTSTRVGMVMGTPAFMAPEQARARWDEVDGRTDLWAVGATMFTLLSGRYVHEAPSEQERLIASATKRASPVAAAAPSVPVTVAAIVDRALAYAKEDRWADADAMHAAVVVALDALGGAEPLAVAPGRPVTRAPVASGVATRASPAGGSDETILDSALTAWSSERELRAAEATRLRTSVSDLSQRYAEAKKRTADAQANVDAGRGERASLDEWFKRQAGTRTAAVEEARGVVRRQALALARRAVVDLTAFGPELQPARDHIARLELAARSAARDVTVHETALGAYDRRSVRSGVIVTAILVLLFVVAPVVWRATRVVEPPPRAHVG
ncbi:MAG TPA: serine/threonine-protein kinase [Polyangiaceae bacterium]|jgi:serine/threonine-protein kinase